MSDLRRILKFLCTEKAYGRVFKPTLDDGDQEFVDCLAPQSTMAKSANTSSAKPLITLSEGNIRLSVFQGPRISVQRIYQFEGKPGFASSFRIKDVAIVKQLLIRRLAAHLTLLKSITDWKKVKRAKWRAFAFIRASVLQ